MENEIQEQSLSEGSKATWNLRFYAFNLQLGSALLLQKEYGQAEELFLPVMKALQKLIAIMVIPTLQRAPLLSSYKGYFYALVCLYGESCESEKMEQYVAANSAELGQWFIIMPGMNRRLMN